MEPTISEIISKFRPLIKKQPHDLQLKFLWLLLEVVAADTDQLKAYIDALHESLMRYAGVVEAYSSSHSAYSRKLQADAEQLLKEFNQGMEQIY